MPRVAIAVDQRSRRLGPLVIETDLHDLMGPLGTVPDWTPDGSGWSRLAPLSSRCGKGVGNSQVGETKVSGTEKRLYCINLPETGSRHLVYLSIPYPKSTQNRISFRIDRSVNRCTILVRIVSG